VEQSDYGKVILPFTLLRRLECVLEATRDEVLKEYESKKALPELALEKILVRKSKQSFYNTSTFDLAKLMNDSSNVADNLESYINAFSPNALEIFEKYEFASQI